MEKGVRVESREKWRDGAERESREKWRVRGQRDRK
jgi:hypothetical protein